MLQLSGWNNFLLLSGGIRLEFGQPNVLISALRFPIQIWVVKEVNANHNAELLVLCVCVVTLFSWFLLGKKNGSVFFRVKDDSDL